MHQCIISLALSLFFMVWTKTSNGQDTLVEDDYISIKNLHESISVLQFDKSQGAKLARFLKTKQDLSPTQVFQEFQAGRMNSIPDHSRLGYLEETVWLAVPLQNLEADRTSWFFDFKKRQMDRVSVYTVRDGVLGVVEPLDYLPIPLYQLNVSQNPIVLLISMQSTTVIDLEFYLRSDLQAGKSLFHDLAMKVLFSGLVLALSLYSFLTFLSTREDVFLYYPASLICTLITILIYNGWQHLFSNIVDAPWGVVLHTTKCIAFIIMLEFSSKFLEWHRISHKLLKLKQLQSTLFAGCFLVLAVAPLASVISFSDYLGGATCLFIFSTSVFIYFKEKRRYALYFILAWSFLFFSLVFEVTKMKFGMQENVQFNWMFLAVAMEPILFSIAIYQKQRSHARALLEAAALSRENLEKLVKIRTKELEGANAKILEKQAEVVQSTKLAALGKLSGGIAHEINNPLAIISASIRQVKRLTMNVDPVVDDRILKIEAQCQRIAKLTAGLQQFSGIKELHQEIFVLSDVVRDSIVLIESRLLDQEIELRFIDHTTAQVKGKPSELMQVIHGLLLNGIEASLLSPAPRLEVLVGESDSRAWVKVIDSGPGIPEDIRENIFQPFFTTKKIGEGVGLGLSSALGIVAAMNGRIFLEEPSPQTTFVVELPIAS
ncbi:7TM diverse intracellular signaling domain-containing protein [Pseudobacteriovorax antillogorgiicola]|nr:7TM diverse intracellular signaling domain-containing protein [Pseudobacteriovorax antillogorgiicola]